MKTIAQFQNKLAKKEGFKSFRNMLEEYRTSSKVATMTVITVSRMAAMEYVEQYQYNEN